jgi:N-acyl-D-amino-acid deacylase
MNMQIIITGGTILDGSGGEPFVGDVLVRDGRIAEIGAVAVPEDATIVDARGLYVAPGVIDIHSHSDYTLYVDPRAISSITQGVTLEVVGNCGHGCAPFMSTEAGRANLYGYQPGDEIPWRGMGEYLDALASRRPAVNVAVLVPNGCLRLAAGGSLDRPSTRNELERMKQMLTQGMEEGAFGYSTGLEYAIERECTEGEIIELCKITAKAGGFYATHTRNRQGEACETIAEAIRTCEASGGGLGDLAHLMRGAAVRLRPLGG